ncbi:MAG: VOC family protein [Candidatus Thorarchaeota archaeon]
MSELKLTKFDQIGILVRNIEKVVGLLNTIFDFKSKINIVEQESNAFYKGEEVSFKMKKIMHNFSGKQLEIVELLESTGDHLYLDFLKQGNVGLHHLGIYVKNPQNLIDYLKKEFNIEVIQTGNAGKVSFYYLDTKEILGFYLELIKF